MGFALKRKCDRQPARADMEKHEEHRKPLRNHSCERGARHAEIHNEDEQRIQQQVGNSADHHREHADIRKALCVDERVHAGGDHREQCAQKIDAQIAQRSRHGERRGAK